MGECINVRACFFPVIQLLAHDRCLPVYRCPVRLHLPLPSAGRATSPCPASPHLRRPRASCLAQNTAPLVPSARRSSAASTHLLVLAQALFRPYPTASPAAAKDTPVRPLLRRPVLAGASIQPPIAKLLVSSSCSSFVWFHFLFSIKI